MQQYKKDVVARINPSMIFIPYNLLLWKLIYNLDISSKLLRIVFIFHRFFFVTSPKRIVSLVISRISNFGPSSTNVLIILQFEPLYDIIISIIRLLSKIKMVLTNRLYVVNVQLQIPQMGFHLPKLTNVRRKCKFVSN